MLGEYRDARELEEPQSHADFSQTERQEIIVGAYYNIGDKILCEEHYKANAEQCPR